MSRAAQTDPSLSLADEMSAGIRARTTSFQSYGFREKFFAVCLVIYAATGTRYVFPSGLPQPADFVMALGTLVMLSSLRIPGAFKEIIFLNAALALYCLVISAIWVIFVPYPDMLRPPIYYIYNVAVFVGVLLLFSRAEELFYKTIKIALILAAISFVIQYLMFYDPDRLRQRLGFNNPNQPGYFALCLISTSLVLLYRRKISVTLFYSIGVVLAYMLMLGLSMTAFSALLLGLGLSIVLIFRSSPKAIIIAFLILPGVGLLAANYIGTNQTFVNAFQRIMTQDRLEGKLDDVAVRRGYARIMEMPHLAIFGAGESGRDRFDPRHRQEIHSSAGTILFSYGLFGLFVYLYWHAYALFRGGIICFLILMLPFIYSLAHQGLRTTVFWILLATVMIAAFENQRERERRAVRYIMPEPR